MDDHQAHSRLHFAWGVLRATGVLRDGMRLEEVVGLLGQPTKVGPEFAEWYYSSGMHVNPCLRWRTDGGARVALRRRATDRAAVVAPNQAVHRTRPYDLIPVDPRAAVCVTGVAAGPVSLIVRHNKIHHAPLRFRSRSRWRVRS